MVARGHHNYDWDLKYYNSTYPKNIKIKTRVTYAESLKPGGILKSCTCKVVCKEL